MFCSICGKQIEGDARVCASCGNPVGPTAPPVSIEANPATAGVGFIDRQASRMAEGKKRHGCLTAYLVLMIIANSALALIYLASMVSEDVRSNLPDGPKWLFPVSLVTASFNLICSIALLRWKEWGFWGYCVSAAVSFVINLEVFGQRGFGQSILGLGGLFALYGVLHIGGENAGWSQLD